jgi:hypothetical protein
VTVNSNGYLYFFNDPGTNEFQNVALPAGNFGFPTVLVYWDDLITSVYYQFFAGGAGPFAGPTSIFQWSGAYCDPSVQNCGGSGSVLFQALMSHSDGRMLFQYSNTLCAVCVNPHSNGASATVGIQYAKNKSGPSLTWSFDSPNIPDGSTVLITPTPEPGSMLLISCGLILVGALRRRRT